MTPDHTSSSGSGWIKGMALVVAISCVIFVLTKVKSDQNAASHALSSGIDEGWTEGTQDEQLGQAIAADDFEAVRQRLPEVPKGSIRENIVTRLSMDRKSNALRAFLQAGWDPDGPARDGRPLETALSVGQFKAVRVLVENKASLNILTREGYTPLVMASATYNVSPEVIEMFLKAGAKVDQPTDELVRGPMGMATGSVSGPLSKPTPQPGVMGRMGPPPKPQRISRVPMDFAVAANRVDLINLLLKYGAKLDLKDRYRGTLIAAVLRNEDTRQLGPAGPVESYSTIDLANLLIARGADVEYQQPSYVRFKGEKNPQKHTGTALYMAVGRGDLKMIPVLMAAHANPNTKCEGGKTPMQIAKGDTLAVLQNKPPSILADKAAAGPGAN